MCYIAASYLQGRYIDMQMERMVLWIQQGRGGEVQGAARGTNRENSIDTMVCKIY